MTSRRSGNTCAECRARKVKCDGRKEICTPCERLRLHCSFERTRDALRPTPDPSAVTGRRAKAACKGCQNLKARCSGERPRCQRCVSRHIDCVYITSKRRSNVAQQQDTGQQTPNNPDAAMSLPLSLSPLEASHTQTTLSPKEFAEVTAVNPLLNQTMILRVLEAFFQNIQPLPMYSYLHKASLIHRFQTGLLSPSLLLALIGITCDILDLGPSMREIGHACLAKAEDLVMKGIKVPSAVKIQALILIIEANVRQGQTSAAFMLFAIASRFAYALRLNHEAPRLCFLEQESRRRLMWSLYLIDATLAGGIREFSLCHSDTIYLQLPCQERNFELDIAQKTDFLKPRLGASVSENMGSLGMYLRVRWMRYRILEMTKQAVLSQSEDLQKLPGKLEELAKDLDSVIESLPSDLQFTERNLQLRTYSARFAPFMLIHLWWRQCRCDLYRVVLTGLREALREEQILQLDPSIVSYYRMKCFESAKEMSSFLSRLQWLREKGVVLELDLLVCAYQCMRLLQQSFRHSDLEASLAHESLGTLVRQCVECIQALHPTSPYSQRIVSRRNSI
jgi:hypothetical protein